MTQLSPNQEISLTSVLTDFPNYFNNFQANFQGLLAQSGYAMARPVLRADYENLVRRASENYNKLNAIRETLDNLYATGTSIKEWITGGLASVQEKAAQIFTPSVPPPVETVDESEESSPWDEIEPELSALPLVVIGAGAAMGIIIAVADWFKDVKIFSMKIEEQKRLESTGLTPKQASDIVEKQYPIATGMGLFGIPVKWLILGGLAVLFLPQILAMVKRK